MYTGNCNKNPDLGILTTPGKFSAPFLFREGAFSSAYFPIENNIFREKVITSSPNLATHASKWIISQSWRHHWPSPILAANKTIPGSPEKVPVEGCEQGWDPPSWNSAQKAVAPMWTDQLGGRGLRSPWWAQNTKVPPYECKEEGEKERSDTR